MTYQVFIERARDASPAGLERAAAALAERYGFPAQVVLDRMRGGRFAAWNDLDLPTAQLCAREVEGLGVVVSIVDQAGRVQIAPAGGQPMAAAQLPSPGRARVSQPPPPRPPVDKQELSTGLAAAFAGAAAPQALGALEGATDDSAWTLATVDGDEEAPRAAAPARAARPSAPAWSGDDPFLPPEIARERSLELDADDLAAPPPAAPAAPSAAENAPGAAPGYSLAAAKSLPDLHPQGGASLHRENPATVALERLASNDRARFAAGVLLAVLLGFLPANVMSCARAGTFDEIRADLGRQYQQADTPEAWANLTDARNDALSLMESRRRNIAISSSFLWLLAGGGLAFTWFRVIDWRRWQR